MINMSYKGKVPKVPKKLHFSKIILKPIYAQYFFNRNFKMVKAG